MNRKLLAQPKGVLFDLGNTILREGKFDLRSGITKLVSLAIKPPSASLDAIQEVAAEIFAEARQLRDTGPIEFPFRSFLRILCDQFGIHCDLAPDDLELEVRKSSTSMTPMDGIEPVLNGLANRGIRLGVVSNAMFGPTALRWELDRFGLARWFEFIMSSADYGLGKPHAAFFRAALARLELEAKDVWFVGDNFEKDVVGASQAGLTAVWLNSAEIGGDGIIPAAQIRRWGEFLELLAYEC